jgi:nitroreductase
MNEVTKLMQNHRSIRKYTEEPIPDDMLKQLFDSAQWAPSSHNVQAYSIIVVKDKMKKQKLSEICARQGYVKECPVFLVFCADFFRLKVTTDMHNTNFNIGEMDSLFVGCIDTALAAQNVMIAAESLGLGGVMIGGIRNDLREVSTLLKLPKYTIPLMGMCLGFPAQDVWQKPRLPQHVVVHKEYYNVDNLIDGLREYEEISADYYNRRTNGTRKEGWTKQMSKYFSSSRRPNIKDFIISQGFDLK